VRQPQFRQVGRGETVPERRPLRPISAQSRSGGTGHQLKHFTVTGTGHAHNYGRLLRMPASGRDAWRRDHGNRLDWGIPNRFSGSGVTADMEPAGPQQRCPSRSRLLQAPHSGLRTVTVTTPQPGTSSPFSGFTITDAARKTGQVTSVKLIEAIRRSRDLSP